MNDCCCCKYQVCSKDEVIEGELVKQYGLLCIKDDGTQLMRIDCICTDFEEMTRFSMLLNEEQLSPVHFSDVVEDFLVK